MTKAIDWEAVYREFVSMGEREQPVPMTSDIDRVIATSQVLGYLLEAVVERAGHLVEVA